MKFVPHKWQRFAIDHAIDFLRSAQPGDCRLYAAPTGVGKSVIQVGVMAALLNSGLVTPRQEILDGIVDKGADPERVWTPIKLRNALLKGVGPGWDSFIQDESHHESAESWRQLDLLLGKVPRVGYTATPYRGSPRATKDFLDRWGDPVWLITMEEAAKMGYLSVPQFTMQPLVDDDLVEVSGSEFSVTSLDSITADRIDDMARVVQEGGWYDGDLWDVPTVFAMPSSRSCALLQRALAERGVPSMPVSAETPPDLRRAVFDLTVRRKQAILHINIVSEGVDLPLRRLVDMAPTLSPVKWVQQLGRITRPGGKPVYVCTNRNLLRHAYALEGAVPSYALAEASAAFPKTERAHTRVLGLESIGRFKPEKVELSSGVDCHIYSISTVAQNVVVEYCCVVHPGRPPIWAVKVNTVVDGQKKWGSWMGCEPPTEFVGFGSVSPKELSPKQQAWWERSAATRGLKRDQKLTKKNFQALPVLMDLGEVLS